MSGPEIFATFLIIGILLITVEIFIPGGVLGILGAVALTIAAITGFFAFGAHGGFMAMAGMIVLSGIVVVLWLKYFPRTSMGKGITLATDMQAAKSAPLSLRELVGRSGVATSDLRPSGVADIAGQRIDVSAESGFINQGAPIRVLAVEGIRVIVRESK